MEVVHFSLVVLCQTSNALVQPILFRYAYERGAKLPIVILYSLVIGFIFNLSVSVYWDEWSLAQNLYVMSFALASTKLASIISTLVPALIFLLGLRIGKEKWSISKAFMAKVVGIVVMPIGIVLYLVFVSEGSLWSKSSAWEVILVGVLGLVLSSPITTWFINETLEVQSPEIAHTFAMAALMNLFGILPATIYALCRYRDMKYYSLKLDTTIGRLLFLSVLVSVVTTAGAKWCTQERGTSYVAAFSNLALILDTLTAPLILNRKLLKGSIVSFVVIVIGVRLFHWGNTKQAADDDAAAAAMAAAERDIIDRLESEIQTAGVNTTEVSTPADAVIDMNTITGYDHQGEEHHHTHTSEVSREDSEVEEGENEGVEGTDDDDDLHQGQRIDDISVGEVVAVDNQEAIISTEDSTDHHETESHSDHEIEIRNDVLENQTVQPREFCASYIIELATFYCLCDELDKCNLSIYHVSRSA